MKRAAANLFLVATLFYFAMMSSWYICYSGDFYYPLVYVSADIGGKIRERADSQKAFEMLAPAGSGQHMGLFRGVLKSVENGGEGLDKLKVKADGAEYPFLSPAEREKLYGVAAVLDLAKGMFRPFVVLCLMVCIYMIAARVLPYSWRQMTRAMSYSFCAMTALFYFLGFGRVFSFFHSIIFGQSSAYFFKSENGLLSGIMPYPTVYAFLSAVFLITLLACWGIYYGLCAGAVRLICKTYR